MRDIILTAIEIKTGSTGLEDLLPLEPSKKLLRADSERLGGYDALVTKPQGLWPEPQGMSIIYVCELARPRMRVDHGARASR